MPSLKAFINGFNKYLQSLGKNIHLEYKYNIIPQKFKIFKKYNLKVYYIDYNDYREPINILLLDYSKTLKIEDENKTDEIVDSQAQEIIALILEKLVSLKLSV